MIIKVKNIINNNEENSLMELEENIIDNNDNNNDDNDDEENIKLTSGKKKKISKDTVKDIEIFPLSVKLSINFPSSFLSSLKQNDSISPSSSCYFQFFYSEKLNVILGSFFYFIYSFILIISFIYLFYCYYISLNFLFVVYLIIYLNLFYKLFRNYL